MKRVSLFLLILIFATALNAQMPPHPELVEKIKSGEIETPYALRNISELKARGVSSEWTSEGLANKNAAAQNKEDVHRIFGPQKAVSGTFNAIFLFVEFTDQGAQVALSSFDDLLFSTSSGSMRHYYDEISYGNLDLITADMPSSLSWVNAPESYDYYVDGQNGFGNYPANAQGLTRDLVELVDPVVDFSDYDNDGDGYVDALFIVHTGSGAEFTGSDDDIWSHAWAIPNGGYLTDDGVRALRYGMQPEFWNSPGDMTIGVYVHEMGHSVFGLPDVYDRDNSSAGLGDWSLMAGGSWNGSLGDSPAWPDAWNHIQMGYVTPTTVTTDLISESITAMTNQPDVYKMWKDGSPGSEYFLVQNRQRAGYDSALPSDGLLIWHVDETASSQNDNEWYPGNTNSGNYLVALEQADGDWDLEKGSNSGDSADPFPGSANNTQFNFASTPNSNSYSGDVTNVTVENISASANTMTADLLLSAPAVFLQVAAPNGGESWQGSSEQIIEWSSNGITDVTIELSVDGGSNWTEIETTYDASTGQYSWVVPNTPSSNCLVRITDVDDNGNTDESNATFEITAAPEVQVVSPNGGESYESEQEIAVTWTSSNVASVRIEYSANNGVDWSSVVLVTPSDGSFDWTVPDVNSTECLVRVTDLQNGNVIDESDAVFEIVSTTLAAPNLVAPVNQSSDLDLSVDFSWDPVANAEEYGLIISEEENFNSVFHEESGITSENKTLDIFMEGIKYYWSVYAVNTSGTGPSSTVFNFITKVNSPDSLSATVYTHTPNQVHLSWNDNSANEAGYKIERMGMDLTWYEIDSVAADQTSWMETIENPETYTYRVKAYTEFAESEYSNEAGVLISSVEDDAVPTAYTLEQNYPNPFNPSTQIRFGLPFESNVKLKIYNILGQTVTQLANETMQSGYHTLEWNAGNLTSGIYFYSIEANSVSGDKTFNSVKKMLLVK